MISTASRPCSTCRSRNLLIAATVPADPVPDRQAEFDRDGFHQLVGIENRIQDERGGVISEF